MRMRKPGMAWISLVGCMISACSTMGPESNLFGGNRVTTASANQMFDSGFEDFDDDKLFRLLDPTGSTNFQSLTGDDRIKALSLAFLNANNTSPPEKAKARRNQILNHLIAASNQRCNLYMTYLKRINTYTNGIFGTLTTVLGGAGAIVTGENTARLLSGLAGISSGTRAELSQAIFESVATSVIVPGITKSREEFLKAVKLESSKEEITSHPIEWAVAMGIAYHGLCSMDTGIAYAQKSMQSYDDIGVKKFLEIQEKLSKELKKQK